ncbi:MAG: hypothetical protein ACKV2O_08800 [Acidimicrobiales bacterium]
MNTPLLRRRAVAAAAVTLVVSGSVLISSFPARAIVEQRQVRTEAEARLVRLEAELGRMDVHLRRLSDPDQIAVLSREHYGYVPPGWESYQLVTPEIGDVRLPEGWPFVLSDS